LRIYRQQSQLWIGIITGLLAGDRSADSDTVNIADKFYKLIIARDNEELNYAKPITDAPSQDESVDKELFDALEMTWAYLDQLSKDGYQLPNIDIIQGSNRSALNLVSKDRDYE
jgi:hypothetical protein